MHPSTQDIKTFDLSIVLPRYIEEYSVVKETLDSLKVFKELYRTQIILVNDNGDEETMHQICKEYPEIVYKSIPKNVGKGNAVRCGVMAAEGSLILYTDIDWPIDIESCKQAIEQMNTQLDIHMLIGIRVLAPDTCQKSNFIRSLTSKAFILFTRKVLLYGISDSQCPFKIIRKEVAAKLFEPIILKGYAFDIEIIYLSIKLNMNAVQYQVIWRDTRAKWNFLKASYEFIIMCKDVLKVRFYWTKKNINTTFYGERNKTT